MQLTQLRYLFLVHSYGLVNPRASIFLNISIFGNSCKNVQALKQIAPSKVTIAYLSFKNATNFIKTGPGLLRFTSIWIEGIGFGPKLMLLNDKRQYSINCWNNPRKLNQAIHRPRWASPRQIVTLATSNAHSGSYILSLWPATKYLGQTGKMHQHKADGEQIPLLQKRFGSPGSPLQSLRLLTRTRKDQCGVLGKKETYTGKS